jgi:cell division protein FtsZ
MREGPLADLFRQTEGSQENVAETPAESAAAAAAAAAPPPPAPVAETPVPEPLPDPAPERRPEPQPEPVAAKPDPPAPPDPPAVPDVPDGPEDEPSEQPRLRAVPDPTDAPEMPALPQALRARGEASAYLASIRVVGVGGGGLNALQRMIDADLHGVEFVAINTDAQQLAMSDATVKLQIGRELTSGLGSGSDPDLGRKAAEDSIDRLRQVLRGSDLVFVTAGEGGGTGTGAAPVIARVARELGALTVGIVTMPFAFEGRRRTEAAQAGLDALQGGVDTLIVVPNDRLLEVLERGVSMVDAFRMADDVLRQGVQGICDLITRPGVINLDFADVRTVMAESGSALMGIGMATGPARGREAARRALDSPLIGQRIRGATGVLLSIMGPPELTLQEVTEAAEAVREAAAGSANIIFGTSVDETLGDQLWVTVIATGFERQAAAGHREPERSRDRSPLRELEIDDDLDVPSFLRD